MLRYLFDDATGPARLPGVVCSLVLAAVLSVVLFAGCDDPPNTAPGLTDDPPRVHSLSYAPQRVLLTNPDPDTSVAVPLQIEVTADPGSAPVDRVAFSLLSSGSNLGATGTLTPRDESNEYGLQGAFELPATADQYTLRVFAIAADSLQSNVAMGQLRIIPDTTATP
ncbi:MAG: hypothetical protein ACQETP_07270 [Bacteroidota bacterium]